MVGLPCTLCRREEERGLVPQPGDIDYQPPVTATRKVKVTRLDDEDGLLTQEYDVCEMHFDGLWDSINLALGEHFGIEMTEVN